MNNHLRHFRAAVLLAACFLFSAAASAQNVDLVTLPTRDTVQLTIYNSEDITLAKETRQVTLKKGHNRLQFSWAGTLIDPTSVELRPLTHADEIEIADTVFPGQKPQHLFWNIESEFEGQVALEVSYFTSGLTWQMDYVAISDPDESELDFRGYVRVFNSSGEEYENAQIRLIVGKINLVEKIAELAKRQGIPVPAKDDLARYRQLRGHALGKAAADASEMMDRDDSFADGGSAPKKIVKQGLSEYFMFGVEGVETIPNGWSKRMRAVKALGAKFDTVYRMRDYQYGPHPVRFFVLRNDEEHGLGENPLPNGMVRLFRQNGRDGLSYLGEQSIEYVPIQADIEVNLGADDLVVYERRKTDSARTNFEFHPQHKHVTGWDEQQSWTDLVRNYRGKPIQFELRLQIDGDVEITPELNSTSFDYRTTETIVRVPPRNSSEIDYRLQQRHGTRSKQNRLRLKPAQ